MAEEMRASFYGAKLPRTLVLLLAGILSYGR